MPDVDGDGRGDVAVGTRYDAPGTSPEDAGRAYLFSGGMSVATEPGTEEAAFTVVASPNPVRDRASFTIALPLGGHARLVLYDALGREAAVLLDGAAGPGRRSLDLDASALPAGVYVWRLVVDGEAQTGRLAVVR